MLLSTGKKERLSVFKGSEIEVSSYKYDEHDAGNVWYCAMLDVNLAKSKRKKLFVRHLDPLLKEEYSPPLIKTTFHRLIRPVPPQDLFSDVDFEEGDVIDVAHKGGWWSGSVIKVLGNRRYLIYLRFEPDVIEVDRKNLRPHLVWKDEEWFRCEKRASIEADFSAGKTVEVRREVEHLGDIWAPAIAIKENEDGTLLVKYNSLKGAEDECTKISLPYSKIRPSPPPCTSRVYTLMESVDAFVDSGWCPGVVSKVQVGNRYAVLLGRNKETMEFYHLQLRPSMEWIDGVWQPGKFQVLNGEESLHPPEETTRIRVGYRTALGDKNVLGTQKKLRATRSSGTHMQQNPPVTSSNRGDVVEAGKVSAIESETPVHETARQLPGELGSKIVIAMMNENTPVTSQQGIEATKEFHPSVVLGVPATQLTKQAVKIQGKTSSRKKLQAMNNQKGSANDSVGEKAPVETKNRESVNKRKRGQPRKFISPEAKQKSGVAGNGSKAATIELAAITDDNKPLVSWIHGGNSSSGQSVSRTPDPMLSSVVEKHVDVVETPPARDSTMVLPFAKKSPLWKVIESMEVFKAVPQHPHFSPLVESEEEFREGDAIGAMVIFTGLFEKLNNIQVDDPVSLINRIDECFPKLEKHGFDVTAPRSRICKLLSIKENQTWALEELRVAEKEISEKDNKRRKCEEDIEDLSRKIIELKKVKVRMDKEIARMQSHAAVLDHKVQNIEQEFRATVAAPWK